MKTPIFLTVVCIFCLFQKNANAEVLKFKASKDGSYAYVIIENQQDSIFNISTSAESVMILDERAQESARSKNLEEISSHCGSYETRTADPKLEDSRCYSEQINSSRTAIRRICTVKTFFECK